MVNPGRRILMTWVIALVLLGGIVASTTWVQRYRYRPYLHESLYLPSGEFIEQASLGYRELVADLVWFSTVQYYGDFRQGDHNLDYFQGLIDIVTTLDPHFIFAYIFGAMVVAEDSGQFENGMKILKKGMAENPTNWELPFEIAFLNYLNKVSYETAAHYFDLASRLPGAPERVDRFAAFVYAKAGFADSAIELWQTYGESTDNPHLKELARHYVEELMTQQNRAGVTSYDE